MNFAPIIFDAFTFYANRRYLPYDHLREYAKQGSLKILLIGNGSGKAFPSTKKTK
ncbi:MAG TPA: hypothetical protein VNN76_01885 [Bacteroidota bacterium]|nr:hypothetical protein [Bacteroidota bacterium]